MGNTSFNEDIEERRRDWMHMQAGVDGIVSGLSSVRSLDDLRREQIELRDLSDRLISLFSKIKLEAEQVFSSAERLWNDPRSQVLKRLEKREDEIRSLREKLKSAQVNLSKCYKDRDHLSAKLETLVSQNKRLQAQIEEAQAYELSKAGVTPLKHK